MRTRFDAFDAPWKTLRFALRRSAPFIKSHTCSTQLGSGCPCKPIPRNREDKIVSLPTSPVTQKPIRERIFVHIIESPKPKDLLDRRTEGLVLSEALRLAQIKRTYNLAVSKDAFLDSMVDRLIAAIHEHNRIPILHLSVHGNEEQIALTDDHRFSWEGLRPMLVPINKAMGGNLLVCLSTCSGASGQRMAMREKGEHPFTAIVGNYEDARWDDSAVAFVTFYHRLFKGATLEEAVEAMKVASGDKNFTVRRADDIQKGWIEYINREKAPDLARRIEEIPPLATGGEPSPPTPG